MSTDDKIMKHAIVRRAEYSDVPRIMQICTEARTIMRSDGNLSQWTGGYPSEEIIRSDISNAFGYVIEKSDVVEGYFAFIPGIEDTYINIEGGHWVDDTLPYCTIHRLASTVASRGIAEACFGWAWNHCRNLRIDTHENNRIMRHCVEKFGFRYCGVIRLHNGDPRLAYQRTM